MLNTRKINGFPNYEISEDGVILNLKTSNIVTHQLKDSGYYSVWLNNKQVKKCLNVHRILLQAFVPNIDNLPCIDHIDQNKLNNNLENLRYCTHAENARNRPKSYKNKLGKHISNSNQPYYRITIIDKGKKVYDKNFCKSKYSIKIIRTIRNNALSKLGLPQLNEML